MENVASRIIAKCGGHQAVAEMVGVDIANVYRWTYPRARGGTDGIIPSRHQAKLLQGARARGLPLEPADFFPSEVAA